MVDTRRHRLLLAGFILLVGGVGSCKTQVTEPPVSERIQVERPGPELSFAVIGDYGLAGDAEGAVAKLVDTWSADVIVTLGDNNYPNGTASTIDANIGQYYHHYIAPYRGEYGQGADVNRFFPSLGNHDWRTSSLAPYLDYFSLPGNERYYDFVWGPVHFFAIDSDDAEPDGVEVDGAQAAWLRKRLTSSTAPWQIVYMHHPPYSSGDHGSTPDLQWPFFEWGADVVMAGHDHHYERIERDGGVYLINGLSGNPKRYGIGSPVDGSQHSFNARHGAIRGDASDTRLTLVFVDTDGATVDQVTLERAALAQPPPEETPAPPAEPQPDAVAPETYDD